MRDILTQILSGIIEDLKKQENEASSINGKSVK